MFNHNRDDSWLSAEIFLKTPAFHRLPFKGPSIESKEFSCRPSLFFSCQVAQVNVQILRDQDAWSGSLALAEGKPGTTKGNYRKI